MKTKITFYLSAIALVILFGACKKVENGVLNTGNFADTTGGTLKSAASFPIGFGIDYTPFMTNPVYSGIVAREGSSVTFGYEMKHGAIVKNDGSFDYTKADALFNAATAAGLQVFGHTLVWHQNQNATYLNTLTKGVVSTGGPNLILNGGFETAGSGKLFANWSDLNHSNGTFSVGTGGNVHGGSVSLAATTTESGSSWGTQILSDAWPTTPGKTYNISFWIKGASPQTIQFEIRNSDGSVSYQGGKSVTTSWSQITYSYTAPGTTMAIAFDLGGHANTFYIDDVSAVDPTATPPAYVDLVANGNFETAGSGKLFANWSDLNHSNGTFSVGTGGNVHGGSSSLAATTTEGGNNYNTQILSDAWPTTPGKTYNISFWIRGASPQNVQFEIRNSDGSVNYQGGKPVNTSWSQITYSYTAPGTTMSIAFDLGGHANTFFIDDVSASDASIAPPPTGGDIAAAVDSAMSKFIRSTVSRYAGKIKAWDVVNEPMSDNGSLRTNTNSTIPSGATDYFFWSQYLGRDYALKAFNYAKAADPNALLFINEYGLQSTNTAKLDSLIAFVKELQSKGAKVDGIGTQMHININTSYNAIDNMFQKLAATGLKIRISEMDVRINPTDKLDISPIPTSLAYQAVMYKYVVDSYKKYVPAAQQYGITIWGVDDASSWIVTSQKKTDYPLLFDAKFAKKPAYAAFLEGLKGLK